MTTSADPLASLGVPVSATSDPLSGLGSPVQQSGPPLSSADALAHPPVATVQPPESQQVMDMRAYSSEHPVQAVLSGNPAAGKVDAMSPFSTEDNAPLPLKIAAGAMGAMAPGSELADTAGAEKGVARAKEFIHPEAGKAAAGAKLSEVEQAIGNHTVQMTDKLADALAQIKEGIDTGGHNPQVVNKLVTRLADVEEGPLTYKEARSFYSNLGDLSTADKTALNTKMGRLVNNVKQALGETIQQTADSGQKLAQYQQGMKGYAQASRDAEKLDAAKALVTKWGTRAAGLGAGAVLWKELKDLFE